MQVKVRPLGKEGITGGKGRGKEAMVGRGAYAQCTICICIKMSWKSGFIYNEYMPTQKNIISKQEENISLTLQEIPRPSISAMK